MTIKIIIVVSALFVGCVAASPIKPTDLNYELKENTKNIGYVISSSSLEFDIQVIGKCTDKKRKFSISLTEKGTNKKPRQPQWSFFYNGEKNYKSYKVYNTKKFNTIMADFKVAKYLGSHNYSQQIDLTSPKLMALNKLCDKKQTEYASNQKKKSEKRNAENKKLINAVSLKTGLKPMFRGQNEQTFNELIYIFQNNGFKQHKNKFVWASDGDYKVSQVLNNKIMLRSYNVNLPPITIITKLSVLEGQFWSKVSRAPLKFIGVNSYKTVLGASKQTIVFQQL